MMTRRGRSIHSRSICSRRSGPAAGGEGASFGLRRSSKAGNRVIMGTRQTIKPPPLMTPISWMPLKLVTHMARNAPAVVKPPVKMPMPV